ncbi:hypothetical protein ACFGVS_23890 [Mucilaginibacter sp. AW1-7]|uniref:pPIWI-associating nuclease domain-containing protein n=1 Tax=Mucilaginibacter sp. AW1-7 TaxID=3349874 RepID=UPI003F73F8C6
MIEEFLHQSEQFATNDFQKELLIASINNLSDQNNKLRFNNFACGIRELSRHVLSSLAPDEEVLACSWYQNETDKENGISRAQRVRYAIHGGLDIDYIEENLFDIKTYIKGVISTVALLSKYTHVNESTFGIPEEKVAELSSGVVRAFQEFMIAIENCREKLIDVLESDIDEAFIRNAIVDSMEALDELASHYSLEDIETTMIKITGLSSDLVYIEVSGNIEVILQWGSNSDLRNGDGLEAPTSFPFTSALTMVIDENFPKGDIQMEGLNIDTGDWHEQEDDEI